MFWANKVCVFLVLGAIGAAEDVNARTIPQDDIDVIQKQQNEIQRRNETGRRLIELKNKSGDTSSPQAVPAPDLPALPNGQKCFQANEIYLNDAVSLDANEQAELVAPYLGNCITFGDVDELLRALTNLYFEKGYVTSRVFIPPQDISDGTFELNIVEGYTENYELLDEKSRKEWRLRTAFPFTLGNPLNLRDIEQGLEQINRLKSNNATMALSPGSEKGGTIVRITNESSRPWHLTTGYDNSGSASTGIQQWTGTAGLDDLLGMNDYLSFGWSKDTRAGIPQQSRSLSGFWSLPFGYLTLSGSHSFYTYASRVNTTTASYVSSGYSRTQKIELGSVVYRDSENKANSSIFLRQHTAASFLDEGKLDSSSYRLTSLGWTLGHEGQLWSGIVSTNATLGKGIRALWAKEDEGISDPSTPRAQFYKAEFDLNYYKPFDIAGQKLTYRGTAHAQWSPMTLYSADQISIGGKSSVRGYKGSTLGGDQGSYLQNTLSLALPQTGYELPDKLFGTFSPFVGYDIGALENDAKDDMEKGVISGYAYGLKTSGGLISLEATYARPIRTPAHLDETHHEVYLNAEMSF